MKPRTRPPWWLLGAALVSIFGAAHAIAVWLYLYAAMPVHEDVRMTYVAAEAGLRHGWSNIYDQQTLRALSATFPPGQTTINDLYTFVHPPLVAWLFAPLTAFTEPVAYLIWTILSLAAFVVAWHIAAPFSAGLAKGVVLLAPIGLWPVLSAFYYGQPVMLVLLAVAGSWLLVKRDRPVAGGLALALAFFLKPQLVWMLPVALLVSSRFRVVGGWALGCAILGAASALTLGPAGLRSWAGALQANQADPAHAVNTLLHFFGLGPATIALWILFAAGALAVAYRQKTDVDTVFVAGMLGSVLVTFHFHELDYSILVLAAWLFLRASPALWQRLWLVAGMASVEVLGLGIALGPAWDLPSHGVVIAWCASWVAILAGNSLAS